MSSPEGMETVKTAKSKRGESAKSVKSGSGETVKSGRGESALDSVEFIPRTPAVRGPLGGSHCCTATSRRSGRQCRRVISKYATVCSQHGGSAGQVRRAAQKREIVAHAAEEIQRLGYTPVTDPPRVLMELAGQSVGLKDALGAQVAALNADKLTHVDSDGREFVAALLASYATALKDASAAVGQLV